MIVNIINFIRAVEPRSRDVDLVEPVAKQIELVEQHRFPATWLLQYDALVQGPYVDMLKGLDAEHEIGGWLEIVQPLVEKAGLRWRGRYPWDWHSHVGFSVGYTQAERERLIDVFMADFKATFGRTPATMGCWLMDAHTLGYLHDRYGLVGSCICKDQYGSDGYTLWGGYWNQAFYPSRRNAFMPAQTEAEQIPVPIFRMLGSDPIDQYDADLHRGTNNTEVLSQGVVSLEPVYIGSGRDAESEWVHSYEEGGGGNPEWVRWYFNALRLNPSLAYQYAQVGQENSFGWPAMRDGLIDQLTYLAKLRDAGAELRIETLESSSRWFRQADPLTPPSSIAACGDFRGRERGSAWYNSRYYRINLYWDEAGVTIRDLHLFDERYEERYLDAVCTTTHCAYDTLPLCEGFLWSGDGVRSGLQVMTPASLSPSPTLTDEGEGQLNAAWLAGREPLRIRCSEGLLRVTLPAGAHLECRWAATKAVPFRSADGERLLCCHEGHDYSVQCTAGQLELDQAGRLLRILSVAGVVELSLAK